MVAVALQPNSPDVLHGRGYALGELGHYELAVAAIQRAIAGKPGMAWFHGDLGVNLRSLGRYDEAEAALREAIRLDPNLPHVRMKLGAVFLDQRRDRQQKHSDARAVLADVLQQVPDNSDVRCRLGMVLIDLGAVEEAFALANEGVALAPESPAAHMSRGELFLYVKDADQALSSFETVLTLDPEHAGAHCGRGAALSHCG